MNKTHSRGGGINTGFAKTLPYKASQQRQQNFISLSMVSYFYSFHQKK